MIISRTPFRISFVGGGTDLEEFYRHEPGKVLSTTIDKYIYVVVKRQTSIADYKFRINWSTVEFRNTIDEIEHPIVREALRLMEIDFPLEITTFADIPAFTGLGSSSAFAVGLLHALFALKGEMVTKNTLAKLAAKIEVDILGRNIGKQDHYAAAYGNFNVFEFRADGSVIVEPVFYRPDTRGALSSRLMLFYTRVKRDAHEILTSQKSKTVEKMSVLQGMKELVEPLRETLSHSNDLTQVAELLHKGWLLKKSITAEISSSEIDEYYERARSAGALGGKLLGAGGGGFLLFYVEPENRAALRESLKDLYHMPFDFDSAGTRITYYDQPSL